MHRYFCYEKAFSCLNKNICAFLLLENKILIAIVNFCNVKQG
ncbi:hypothetical protein HMPREF0774_1450 [Staphylococcus aureus subsp. aureus TCH130]|nr:hypothetical protein HMPREF0774_1450 [Staphylococcus aureus subsp. aureus TCH130]